MSSPHDQPARHQGPDRIDYQETPDLTEVHAAVQREKPEPSADVTPMPLWLTGVCAFATVWAGVYFGIFHGGLNGNVYNEYESSPAVLFPQPQKSTKTAEADAQTQTLAQQGKGVYGQCMACHQGNGQGVPGQFPPLASSPYVIQGEKRLIAIILKGIQGPITVNGKLFNGAMPPWEMGLSPRKIAAVASYVRQEWGNKAPEISEAKVLAAKKEFAGQTAPWTEAQLQQIPADAVFPEDAAAAQAPAAASAPATPAAGIPVPPAATGAPKAPAGAGTAPAKGSSAAPAVKPATAAPAAADPAVLAEGKKNYMMICIACHQPTGLGLPMVFPPLTKSEYVNGSPLRFAAMILKGNAGPMTIGGKPYNNIMPGQELMLDDAKIASIMTFVRANFGNKAPPVSPDVVAEARKKYAERKLPWTEPELKAWKDESAGAPAPSAAAPAPAPSAPPPAPAPANPATAPAAPASPGTTAPAPAPSAPVPAPAAPSAPVPSAPRSAPAPANPATAPAASPSPGTTAPAPVPAAPSPPAPAPAAPSVPAPSAPPPAPAPANPAPAPAPAAATPPTPTNPAPVQ